MQRTFSRRRFLAASAAGAAFLPSVMSSSAQAPRIKVAAIYTVMTHRLHAHVFMENFLRPYLFNGERITPPVDIASIYSDQTAKPGDMTQAVAKQFKIPVYKTIA